jgi:hypothetical protein
VLDYLPPGSALSATEDSGRGGGWGGGDEEVEGETAGPYGAIRVRLRLLSQLDDRPYFDSTVLQWLRDNAERDDLPYTIVELPIIDDIGTREVRPAGSAAAVRQQATPDRTSPEQLEGRGGGAGGPGRGGGVPDPRGGGRGGPMPGGAPMPGGRPLPGGGPMPGMPMPGSPMPGGGGSPSPGGGGGGDEPDDPRDRGGADDVGPLSEIAPLTLPDEPFDAEQPVFLHTISFVLQLKEDLDDPGSDDDEDGLPAEEVAGDF